jgi:hypothetical protein
MPPRTVYDRRNAETLRAARIARSLDRDRVHVRSVGDAVNASGPRRGNAVPAMRPARSTNSNRAATPRDVWSGRSRPSTWASRPRSAAPAASPRGNSARYAAPAPRNGSPSMTPRSGASMSPRGWSSGALRGAAPSFSPRSGGGSRGGFGMSMPRGR